MDSTTGRTDGRTKREKKVVPPVSAIQTSGDSITPASASPVGASTRSACWSITINNPTEDDLKFTLVETNGWKIEGQLEKGKEGTPHYQGMLDTPNKPEFKTVKRAFPRAHIEAARRRDLLKKYVNKEETRLATVAGVGRRMATMPEAALEVAKGLNILSIRAEIVDAIEKGESEHAVITRHVDAQIRKMMLAEGNILYAFYAVNPNFISIFRKFYFTIYTIANGGEVRIREGTEETVHDERREEDVHQAELSEEGSGGEDAQPDKPD